MKLFRGVLLALGLALAAGAGLAATVTNLTGPQDPSQWQAALNTMVNQVNGTACAVTGTSPQTCNGTRGVVTTGTLTTAAATDATFTINDSTVTASSVVQCTDDGYSGTLVTNGYPVIMSCVPGAGTITVHITNLHAANALNGTVAIAFTVSQN